MRILFLALLIPFFSFADDECDPAKLPEFEDIAKVVKKLEWFAATEKQVEAAPCARKKAFSNDEMDQWLKKNTSSYKLNESINGISFENESPENLKSFRELTTAMGLVDPEPGRQKTFSSKCKKVDCALKEIFGEEEGKALHFMHRRYGLNGSHLVRENSAPWKRKDLDTVLLALSDYPEGIHPIKDNKMLIRAPAGTGPEGTYANAVITIFEKWDGQTGPEQRATIFHEMAHVMAGTTHVDGDEAWTGHSSWKKEMKVVDGKEYEVYSSDKDNFVSSYAKANPWEDYAESVVAYRYNPEQLKDTDPKKYAFIRDTVFDQVEYTSEGTCSNPKPAALDRKKKVEDKLRTWIPKEEDLRKIANRCNELAIRSFAEAGKVNLLQDKFSHCYEEAIKSHTAEMVMQQIEGDPQAKYLMPMIKNIKPEMPPHKVKKIILDARALHLKDFRGHVGKALRDEYICEEGRSRYAYQRFDENEMGMDPWKVKVHIKKITDDICPRIKDKKKIPALVDSLIK